MKVGLVLEQLLAPVPGGQGRYSREIARAVAVELRATTQPAARPMSYVAWHRAVGAAEVPGVAGPYRVPLGRRAMALAWERGRGPGPGRRCDVVHAPTVLVPPKRAPLVVTVPDAVAWTHPETLTPRGVAFHRRMGERVRRDADVVLTISAAAAADIDEVLHLGDRLRVVPLAVSSELSVPSDAAQRTRRLGLPDEGWLVTVATLEPRKGLDVLLAALAHPAGAALPPLAVVGPAGWGGVDVATEVRRMGLPPDRVRFLGRLPDPDLAAVVSRATISVSPSRAEGFGLPALEALSLGAPVVASTDPALVEVCGGAAVHVPTGDASALAEALGGLIADDAALSRMRLAGRRRASGFSWARAGAETVRAYRDAIG